MKFITNIFGVIILAENNKQYTTLLDYTEKMRATFSEQPFGEIDALAFTQLAYARFESFAAKPDKPLNPIVFTSLLKSEIFDRLFGSYPIDKMRRSLLINLAMSPRFRNTKILNCTSIVSREQQKQFCAMSFLIEDGTIFVAFRGTDNTLVGWRENFNMAFMTPVPAQEAAVSYLNQIASRTSYKLRVGGHSKGGNLSVYAALNCDQTARDRILDIYSHDGPGFKEQISHSERYLEIKDRLHQIMPEGSIIGTLLEQVENYRVVASRASGIEQHDVFNWEIDGSDYHYIDELSSGARRFDAALDNWVRSMDDKTRQHIVELLFSIIEETGASTLSGAELALKAAGFSLQKVTKDLDPEARKYLFSILMTFAKSYVSTVTSEKQGKENSNDKK